jgi:hypothetical protein
MHQSYKKISINKTIIKQLLTNDFYIYHLRISNITYEFLHYHIRLLSILSKKKDGSILNPPLEKREYICLKTHGVHGFISYLKYRLNRCFSHVLFF